MKNISEYFTGDWRTDTWRIQKLIAYVHQADKRDLPVEANCGGYAWVGIYQKVLTSEQLAMIASLQSLHQTSGSVCTMIMPDGGISFPSGEIFLHSKTVKKLKKEAFLMLVAHELSHRVAWRMFTVTERWKT